MMKRDKTKENILKAATHVLSKNPGASFGEIASFAEIARATLYRYFPAKKDLIRELTWEAMRQTDAIFESVFEKAETPEEKLRMLIESVIPMGDQFHFLSSDFTAFEDPDILQAYMNQIKILEDLIDACKADGIFALDVPTAWIASSIDSLVYTAWELINEGRLAREDASRMVLRTMLYGLSKPEILT